MSEKKGRFVFAPVAEVKTGETDFNAPHLQKKFVEAWQPKPVNPFFAQGQMAAKNPTNLSATKYKTMGGVRDLGSIEKVAQDMVDRAHAKLPTKK